LLHSNSAPGVLLVSLQCFATWVKQKTAGCNNALGLCRKLNSLSFKVEWQHDMAKAMTAIPCFLGQAQPSLPNISVVNRAAVNSL